MKSLKTTLLAILLFISSSNLLFGQVPILNYSTNVNGQVQLEVASSEDNYYVLQVRHSPTGPFEINASMTMGAEGTTIVSEPLASYPLDHYRIFEYPISNPADTDGDSIDDITEFTDMPTKAPLNPANSVELYHGAPAVNSLTTFKALSADAESGGIIWSDFLQDKEFVKFVILDFYTDNPKVYFINSVTYDIHGAFISAIGEDWYDVSGEIIYSPTAVANNGTLGIFSFVYTFGISKPFESVQRTQEVLAANMPFLKNNLSYFITEEAEGAYYSEQDEYDDSRVSVLFEADVYADIDYLALNIAEGFGYFRLMELDETPNSRDIVLYESIPNTLPRVGGIMTSFIQTPLSHVNLRAIQDNVPNAFIRDPLLVDSIANLLDNYIYYRVDQGEYFIREATLEEVNDWFEDLRPDEEQDPPLNLSYTSILPLSEISFDMSDGFGAKCTNLATMRTFGFPEGTIPDGFGVPFYFYQEFMDYNGFFAEIEAMIADPVFQNDLETRIDRLKDLRSDIKDADMPQWMLDELQVMHESFPEGTSVRCRSSTNNEDLPGFSGAGLYTSKTQHPDEGHISKSIKQVYASIWNFRAFDERDFYRVDHYLASMGVLCHPNYEDEKANGVGVSLDPIYQTDNTFYLNTQVGEDLVTNPEASSVAEEILLDRFPVTEDDYIVIRHSNLVEDDVLIMSENYLDLMRDYLSTIHDEFAILYDAVGIDGFAMDIEYKITSDDQLIIKQARPWSTYWSDIDTPTSVTDVFEEAFWVKYFPNPVGDFLNIECDCEMAQLSVHNLIGQKMMNVAFNSDQASFRINTSQLPRGLYLISGIDDEGQPLFSRKFFKS